MNIKNKLTFLSAIMNFCICNIVLALDSNKDLVAFNLINTQTRAALSTLIKNSGFEIQVNEPSTPESIHFIKEVSGSSARFTFAIAILPKTKIESGETKTIDYSHYQFGKSLKTEKLKDVNYTVQFVNAEDKQSTAMLSAYVLSDLKKESFVILAHSNEKKDEKELVRAVDEILSLLIEQICKHLSK